MLSKYSEYMKMSNKCVHFDSCFDFYWLSKKFHSSKSTPYIIQNKYIFPHKLVVACKQIMCAIVFGHICMLSAAHFVAWSVRKLLA